MRGAAVKSEKLSRSSIQVKREKAARVAASSDDDENDEEPQASGDGPSQSGTQDAEEEEDSDDEDGQGTPSNGRSTSMKTRLFVRPVASLATPSLSSQLKLFSF